MKIQDGGALAYPNRPEPVSIIRSKGVPLINIFIVDDHPALLRGVSSLFDDEPDLNVIGTSSIASDALSQISGMPVDVLLTDLRMKGMDGDELAKRARATNPHIQVAVLTNYHSDEDVFRAMRAGARAFLLKTSPMEEVITAIRDIHNGETWIPAQIARQLAERVARHSLSAREIDILRLIAKGLKNSEIGEELCISTNTVRNHINNMLEKLKSRDRAEALAVALKQGVLRIEED
jgi:DNA-binding NarL/FixJ family response regulator